MYIVWPQSCAVNTDFNWLLHLWFIIVYTVKQDSAELDCMSEISESHNTSGDENHLCGASLRESSWKHAGMTELQ